MRVTPAHLMRRGRGVPSWRSLIAAIVIASACAALILMVRAAADNAIREQDAAARSRAETVVEGDVNILTAAVQQELKTIDQSLTILQAAWNADPNHFDLKSWQSRIPALTAVASDIFVANDKRVIVQDIMPQAIGQGIGAAYASFDRGRIKMIAANGHPSADTEAVVSQQADSGIIRYYQMYLIRPLRHPAGWVIGASYHSAAVGKVFAQGQLKARGVVALIDTRQGGVQTVAGPAAFHPRLNISDSPMYHAIQHDSSSAGIWVGPTPIDGVVRIHAFRRVPGRHLLVLVGVDSADWMAPAVAWADGVRMLAWGASCLVIVCGGIALWLLWRLDTNRRRRHALEQAAFQLNAAQSGLHAAELAARTGMVRVQAMLDGSSDGIAVFDSAWHLSAWNPPFGATCGLPPELLHAGLPADELLRHQARAGLFGSVPDIEIEVAQRIAQLHTSADLVAFQQAGPHGQTLAVRGCGTPDGGAMLIVTGAVAAPQLPPALPELLNEPEPARERPFEW